MTLAAMIGHINRTRKSHIVTIEDPIEFLHDHDQSIVDQREIGTDTNSFRDAMKHVLRQSPDVVLVGEIRDPETVRTALMLAETGHLVLSTIHTGESAQALSRLADMFPTDLQSEIRVTLSLVVQGIIVQQLLPSSVSDQRRILACEILLPNPAIRHLIREGKFQQIYSELQTRQDMGMQTMNNALLDLWRDGEIAENTALDKSPNVVELKALMEHTRYGTL
ncbi:MAG: Flp pilus assembly complex ATPase component TadA [Lentisphaerae bacterium]|jgi:twitching motility protein PilT|nr:Flp pilus assembly complex ATPase component TadA [Lentisphaerota bacterium]MBT4817566.1 Flp pilus assembly complex ATPase component TadA [Lentisphaerota bacterium]MBT5610142.1 Flp pilus assembly complex ATPase component TadA [Lentisphaerota bacterium]MBT7057371.1 Flp pilus assembly complex ATPase component TadA [Lentisphaerota bacterium]MBT7842130.1 Flp pilus assembly complex ATPase component TadA [Lentisphaerota bacterium]